MNEKTESKYYLSQPVHVSRLWASRLVCLAACNSCALPCLDTCSLDRYLLRRSRPSVRSDGLYVGPDCLGLFSDWLRPILGLLCINTDLRLGVSWRGGIVSVYTVGVGIIPSNSRLACFEECDHRPPIDSASQSMIGCLALCSIDQGLIVVGECGTTTSSPHRSLHSSESRHRTELSLSISPQAMTENHGCKYHLRC